MSRSPEFHVIETPRGWMVSIPPATTSTGKRKRKYFPGKTAAEKFAASLRQNHKTGLRGGMIPVALGVGEGADFRAPLGRAVIGGTITSTILTLLVIPTFYEIIDGVRERVKGMFGKRS